MKKFEFTGEVKTLWWGCKVQRIRALVEIDLGWTVVKPGDLGGWLEKESNLSHDGKAWVWGNAEVWGNAKVCGDAKVWGNAEVWGNAKVCGDAKVWGNAKVCGDAFLFRAEHLLTIGAIGSRNDFTTFFRNKKGEIKVKCGCFLGTVDEFLAKVQQTRGDTKFAVVYRACVTVALAQIDTTPYEGEVK